MKKLLIMAAILLTFVLVIAGCGTKTETVTTTATTTMTATAKPTTPTATATTTAPKPTATTPTPKKGGVLRYIYAYSPGNNIGWPLETNIQNIWGTKLVYAEPLVLYMLDDTAKPWLAESWEFAPDYSSITFKLRKGVKFHDGTDFNAQAVKWQLDMNIELKNAIASYWKSVDVIDDYTVRLNFTEYRNSVLSDLSDVRACFVSPTAYKEHDIDWMREHPIGTGPFKFVSWERDVYMEFTRNDNYWQPGKPYLNGIKFITIKDKNAQMAAMVAGEGDMLALQSGRELYDLDNLGFDIVAYAAGTDFLIPDTANPGSVFSDVRVRMAMDYAIDKEAICKALGYGYMTPNHQIPAPQQPYHNKNIKPRSYDRNKAKQLLAEAGFPDGFKTKLYVEGAAYGTKALAIQAQLAPVGIQAEIVTLDNLKFWEYNMNGWKDGILFAGWSWSPNFAASYNAFFPPTGRFFISVKPPDVSDLVQKALRETDPNKKRDLNLALVQAIFDDCTVIPYLSDAMGWAVAPYVKDHHLILEGADFCSWLPADCWLDK